MAIQKAQAAGARLIDARDRAGELIDCPPLPSKRIGKPLRSTSLGCEVKEAFYPLPIVSAEEAFHFTDSIQFLCAYY
jgi:hypothetical protein